MKKINRPSTLLLYLLQLLCSLSHAFPASAPSLSARTSDAQKLLNFKSSLPNPNILQNWQQGTDPCLFTGVFCNNSRVTSLKLSFLTLSCDFSSVSSHLFPIEQLISLTLKSANISGRLQPFSFCSSSLAEINLSENYISGPFSDLSNFGSCSRLKHVNLSSNLLDNSKNLKGSRFRLSLETLDVSANDLLSGDEVLPWVLRCGCSSLSHLSLKGNKLVGSIPLVGCTHLEYLDLSSNNFSIPIPSLGRHFPSLRYLDLSSNKFSGEIGDTFAGLKNLTYLNVSYNQLTGGFPLLPESSLEFLYLESNQFQGVIPESFADAACSTLVEVNLSLNNFSGVIPSSFGSCSLLETFDISQNNVSGDLPMDIFLKMGNLKKLVLAFNNFVGTLPDSISSLSRLELLDLSSNNISGEIPPEICQNRGGGGTWLRELYLQNNLLTGLIPFTLGNCSQLVSLDLSFNYLTGRIPSSLGSLSKLRDLIMWMNQLEGDIPSELMHNQELEILILDYNSLTGTIPSGLSNCTNLNWVSLSGNKLSGQIPSWIGSLANLEILKLDNNLLYGEIPPELGDCKSLLWLDLNSNLLNGSIPSAIAKQSGFMSVGRVVGKKYVYLRNDVDGSNECHGTGDLLEFSGIRQQALDRIPRRHTCNFTRIFRGTITQPTFNHDGSMIFLDLSFNSLEGVIPKELGSMSYLSILNLGHNNLSGPIPQELGGLKDIGVVDLAHNHISGQIPQSLGGLTFLTEIDFSNNQLSGGIPESGQFETFPADRFYNNSGLCGYPLPNCDNNSGPNAGDSHPSNGSDVEFYAGLYASIALGFIVGFWGFIGTLALKDSWRHQYFRFLDHAIDWVYVKVAIHVTRFKRNRQNLPD